MFSGVTISMAVSNCLARCNMPPLFSSDADKASRGGVALYFGGIGVRMTPVWLSNRQGLVSAATKSNFAVLPMPPLAQPIMFDTKGTMQG